MAVPNTWDYVVPQIVPDDGGRLEPRRVRVVTCLRRGLFADAMQDVMERESFEVIATHDRDTIMDLASAADGCILDMVVDGAHETLIELTRTYSDLRLVVLADASTTHTARAITRGTPNVHVTTGDTLDRVLAILRGEECGLERRRRADRLHSNGGAGRDPRRLTAREAEILDGLLDGENTKVLAARLGVSQATARTHVQSVLSKLGVHSRLEAVAMVNGGMHDWLDGTGENGVVPA
jgi:two-component system nitrate/nitrite response regulator NarL